MIEKGGIYVWDDELGLVSREEYEAAHRGRRSPAKPFKLKRIKRGTWVFDRKTQKLVPAAQYRQQVQAKSGPMVVSDIEPYVSTRGEVVSGRRQHREYLRRHDLVEVGNEKLPPRKMEIPDARRDVAQALRERGIIG